MAEDFSEDPIIQEETRYNWVYSFWMRRRNKGNDQLTYKLIKAIDAKIISKVGEAYKVDDNDYEGY